MDVILVFALTIAQQPSRDAPDIEEFLRSAEVVSHENIPIGVTSPVKIELSDGTRTLRASWKTVDISRRGITRFADGTIEKNFTDSYRNEIAAYELDKLLGTGLVPPAVERRWRSEPGAVQLWIEGAMTDFDRRQKQIQPPDPLAWNRQVYNVQLFRNLTHDVDYKNARNNLIDPSWKLWAIDSSRAFRTEDGLVDEGIDHFSRAVLAKLEALDFEILKEDLGKWLSDDRLRALLARRDRILERVAELVTERGEAGVLVP